MAFRDFFKTFVNNTKNIIAVQVKEKLTGQEKKAYLDKRMAEFVERAINKGNFNLFIKWCLKTFILYHISDITQAIYDLIETKIEGITEEKAA